MTLQRQEGKYKDIRIIRRSYHGNSDKDTKYILYVDNRVHCKFTNLIEAREALKSKAFELYGEIIMTRAEYVFSSMSPLFAIAPLRGGI